MQASAYQPAEQITLSSDEQAIAAWVMAHGRTMGLYDDSALAPSTSARFVQRVIVRSTASGRAVQRSLRLIPLKLGEKVVGVLRLRVLDDSRRLMREEHLEEEEGDPHIQTSFDLERVFDKFYRVLHGQHVVGYPMGSGLGLAVCRGLVEAHGGRIWAEIREGGGLIMFVELPVGERERISS